MIAHPPCTFLCVSGNRWFFHPDDKDLPPKERRPHPRYPNRSQDREEAVKFFLDLYNSPIKYVAVENPIGIMATRFRSPDQKVHPWMFGDSASKGTCWWLKNLPKLQPTDIVDKGEFVCHNGNRMAKWYHEAYSKTRSAEERRKIRSKTFQGMAAAMAKQWTEFVEEQYKINQSK